MERIKCKVYNLIREDDINDLASNIFDSCIIGLIIVNVVLIIAETFNLPPTFQKLSNIVETISVVAFTIEYGMRLWTATYKYPTMSSTKARIRYMFTFMAMIDLLAILPFYLPFILPIDLRVLRMVRIVRLLRIFKVNRYTNALHVIGSILKEKASQLTSSLLIVLILMIISSVLMYNVENAAQPDKFENAFSGLWWSVATFTTVGYGDIYPITVIGKILSGVIAILGIGLVAVPTGIISAGFIEHVNKKESAEEIDEKHYCPYCGKRIK